jgi:hypothetical protein
MPAGPAGAFAGISDADARDIAHYLLSLEPADNALPNGCQQPMLPDPASASPFWLSAVGMYADIASKRLAADLIAFEPAYPLWSDGAEKRRWLRLPAGTRIDSSDMDHWRFPVGSMVFKEFTLAGRRIETRVIARTGEGEHDYWLGAFVWNEDESDARFVPDGMPDALDTSHDVPSVKTCGTCHQGEPGRVLGFSAVQQRRVPADLLSAVPERAFAPPGDATAVAALGYLHANCGPCHNPRGSARPDSDMDLTLSVRDRTVAQTAAFRTAVGQRLSTFRDPARVLRIAPGEPENSALLQRMSDGRREVHMPPLGARRVDPAGVATVRAWIQAL